MSYCDRNLDNFMNYIGKKYNRLIIKKISNRVINGRSRKIAICNCSCGIENKEIRLDGILEGAVKSCGCYSTEVKKQKKKAPNPLLDLRKRLLNSAKVRANKDNLKFNIKIDDIIIPSKCPAIDIKIYKAGKEATYNSPALDKIIPSKGYVKGNVAVISHRGNNLKTNMNVDEITKLVKYLRKMKLKGYDV